MQPLPRQLNPRQIEAAQAARALTAGCRLWRYNTGRAKVICDASYGSQRCLGAQLYDIPVGSIPVGFQPFPADRLSPFSAHAGSIAARVAAQTSEPPRELLQFSLAEARAGPVVRRSAVGGDRGNSASIVQIG